MFFVRSIEREKNKKERCAGHTLIVDKPAKFYSFISDYLFEQTAKIHNPDGLGKDSLFFEYLNDNRILIEIVSDLPLSEQDVDSFLPQLSVKNNKKRSGNPIVLWDMRPLEKRVMRAIEKQKNLFERYPYYCAGLGMFSTGISCGVSGWFLHSWLSNRD